MTRSHMTRFITAALAVVLAGCSLGGADPTPTAVPEATFVPLVSATGQVVPVRWASLSVPVGGVVAALPVVEGDTVAKDELLLQLSGREQLEAILAGAQLDQITAQQALDQVFGQEDLARAQAQNELALARDELRKADYDRTVQQEGNRASDDTIKRGKANVVLAQDRVDQAKGVYDSTGGSSDDPARAAAQAAYLLAKAGLDSARRSLNWYTGHPTEIQQAMLDADVALAKARVAQAEAAWADVEDRPDPDVLALAEARLKQTTAAVRAAEAALRDAELRAPFAGTVAAVETRRNEYVAPGLPVIDLADLTSFQVETTDLSEIDAARVALEAPVTITFDALPGVVSQGRVVRIAPRASQGSGVNYTVWIQLDDVAPGLLWGMTAFVDIEAAP
jgi:HlyD family secretion protein